MEAAWAILEQEKLRVRLAQTPCSPAGCRNRLRGESASQHRLPVIPPRKHRHLSPARVNMPTEPWYHKELPSLGLAAALWPRPSLAVHRPHRSYQEVGGKASWLLPRVSWSGPVTGADEGEARQGRLRTRLPDSSASMQDHAAAAAALPRPRQGPMCTNGSERFESGLRREQTTTAMQRAQIK